MDKKMLYIVGTPIGNLGDITLRALEILKEVDVVACEDTRVSAKLLDRYEIKKSLISVHQHSRVSQLEKVIEKIKSGQKVALVTDAGTPGISDPGNQLVKLAFENNIEVVPIPGVSALTALVSVSGIDMQRFVFLGFPPHKKGRETFFKKVLAQDLPVIFFESRYRIIKCLKSLLDLGGKKNVIIGKELTKMHEEIFRGSFEEALDYFEKNPEKQKGEFIVIVY